MQDRISTLMKLLEENYWDVFSITMLVLKSGTCLLKCYIDDYRFSEGCLPKQESDIHAYF